MVDKDILTEVNVIREKCTQGISKNQIMTDHTEFYNAYPRLFNMLQDTTFDISILKYMMSCREKINDTNVNDMDAEVMNTLKEKYIDSVVGSQYVKDE